MSRARFKLALRFIKRHEDQLRQDTIANALCDDSEGKFRNEIKKMSPNYISLPSYIESATGKKDITDIWKCHFKELINCLNGNDNKYLYYNVIFDPGVVVNPEEVEEGINKLQLQGNHAPLMVSMLNT